MSEYRGILIKEAISYSILLLIVLVVCFICFASIKKFGLQKNLYYLVSAFLVFAIVIGGYYVGKVLLDLHDNSFETYTGKCSFPSRDTVLLDEYDNLKLYSAISIPNTSEDITIIYSKHSKIVVGFQN